MKKLTRIAALLLVLVLAVSLCACGGSTTKERDNDPKEKNTTVAPTTPDPITALPTDPVVNIDSDLVGKWCYEMDLTQTMVTGITANLGIELTEEPTPCICPLYLTFNADATCQMEIGTEDFGAAFLEFLSSIIPYMVEVAYQQGAAQGLDRAAMDQQIMDAYGMTLAEFYEATFAEMNPADLLGGTEDLNLKGTYSIDGDRLYIVSEDEKLDEENYVVFTLKDDEFSITEFTGDESAFSEMSNFGITLPLTFTREK